MPAINVKMVRFYICQLNAMKMAEYYYPNCYSFDTSHQDKAKFEKWSKVFGVISNAFDNKYGVGSSTAVFSYLKKRYQKLDVAHVLKEINEGTFDL